MLSVLYKRVETNLRKRNQELQDQLGDLQCERDALVEEIADERKRLNDELQEVRNELADLKRQKKHEEEDIAHLIKIKESKLETEYEKKEIALEKRKNNEIAKVKDEYRDKLETLLKEQVTRGEKIYEQILGRLPDVNVALKGRV